MGSQPRALTAYQAGQVHVIELHGEAGVAVLAAFETEVDAILRGGRRAIVIDLRDVPFVASAIVNAIFRVCRRVRAGLGTVAVVCTDTHTRRVMELTSLDRAVTVCSTVDDAIGAVSSG